MGNELDKILIKYDQPDFVERLTEIWLQTGWIPSQLVQSLPYVITLVVLAVFPTTFCIIDFYHEDTSMNIIGPAFAEPIRA